MLHFRYPLWKLTTLIALVAVGLICVRYNTFWSRLILIELLVLGFLLPAGSLVRKARFAATSRSERALIGFAYMAVLFAFGWGIVALLSRLQYPHTFNRSWAHEGMSEGACLTPTRPNRLAPAKALAAFSSST